MNQAPATPPVGDVFFPLSRDMAILAPAEILGPMWSPDETSVRFRSFNEENAREFFLHKVLCDVQHAGFSLARLSEYLSAPPQTNETLNRIDIRTRISEHSVWQRRLVEMLVHLVGFAGTNEPAYYFHYLILAELADLGRETTNQRDYFGSESLLVRRERDARQQRAAALLADGRVSQARCWYMAGNGSASMNRLLSHALEHATPMERRSLGYCYEIGYSDPSEAIHFSALSEPDATIDDVRFVGTQIAFLCAAIVTRVQELFGIVRNTPMCSYARRATTVATPNGLAGYHAVGDFVIASLLSDCYLAQVEEVILSRVDNESYRVRFLVERPHALEADTLLSKHVAPFMTRVSVRERVRATIREHAPLAERLRDEELDESARDSAIHAWNIGLRTYMRRRWGVGNR